MLAVTVLGNNSAIPAFDRHPAAQVVQTHDQLFLIDCGEGTQSQLIRYKIKHSKIDHIFISHLHGDHYFGLIGLLTSMGLLGRKNQLHLYGPQALEDIINLQLQVADTQLPYTLHFHPLGDECILFEDKTIIIECIQVFHRIPCWGFLFREKKNSRKIDPDKVKHYKVPVSFYNNLQRGEDYLNPLHQVIRNEELTSDGQAPRSYAYCADTIYNAEVARKIKSVNVIYHEATYLDNLKVKAASRFHSTSKEAAMIARDAGAERLLLGHFSSKYENLEEFEIEARTVFERSEIATEGTTFLI